MNKKFISKKRKQRREKAPLVDALEQFAKHPSYQFHIPGHTGGKFTSKKFKNLMGKALTIDTTDEFDGLGTLHPATGPIRKAELSAARAFGAGRTLFLVNGSTAGNLAVAMGMTKKGQKVIVNRNCHRSILTGLIISGAEVLWAIPETLSDWGIWGEITPQQIEKMLKENNDVALVWITNPTYEGVVSDIKSIAEVCKKYNVPLVVDEAHGCLWKFCDELPMSALDAGADIVINSLHKTGGSMSQSSMLHISKNSKFNADAIEKALKLVHTTSPSMLLMASLDAARANLESDSGKAQIKMAVDNAKYLRKHIDGMKKISHLISTSEKFKTDVTKVFIKADGLTGTQLEKILETDFKIEVESSSDIGILILCNPGNTKNDIKYLIKALSKIDKTDYSKIYKPERRKHMPLCIPITEMSMRNAYYSEKENIKTRDAIGRICAEVIAECPPGISILLPGEVIREEHLPYLFNYKTLDVVK
ncbi:aminotransferase class V-fold PLP-dependent enzyme [bacterium]|nr:aminotransferase class V-fold PLP-dependent enzyme [bacterium]